LAESPSAKRIVRNQRGREVKGYDKKKHAYAVRMLAELEDAQKEVSLRLLVRGERVELMIVRRMVVGGRYWEDGWRAA
jgi:hypothetical protein